MNASSPLPKIQCLNSYQVVEKWVSEFAILIGKKYPHEVINLPLLEAFPELAAQGFRDIFGGVYHTGEPYAAKEMPIKLNRRGVTDTFNLNIIFKPLFNERSEVEGIIVFRADVTEHIVSRNKLEESEQLFRTLAETLPQLVWITNEKGEQLFASGNGI